ncbi:MAG: DUF4398 domain-containing protein [Deltaproteobacteria bacterium]|nr:DUF4398 domain-containing protein [Deltaproteobacteria bacterium]
MSRAEWKKLALVVSLVVTGAVGCGPVMYVHEVVIKAESSGAAAKVRNAAKYAPYEYYGACAYLKQARVRAGYGDFQWAIKYGEKSSKMAKKAIRLTKQRIEHRRDVGDVMSSPSAPATGAAARPASRSGSGRDTEVPDSLSRPSGTKKARPAKVEMPGGTGGSQGGGAK